MRHSTSKIAFVAFYINSFLWQAVKMSNVRLGKKPRSSARGRGFESHRMMDELKDRQKDKHTERQTNAQTDRKQKDRKTERLNDRKTERQ